MAYIRSIGNDGQPGIVISDDTTTDSNSYYPVFSADQTTGPLTTGTVSSTNIYFNPSTGTINSTNFNSLSDENLKKNIEKISNATELIKSLEGVEFEWKDNDKKSSGLIAQEVEKIMPHLVESNGKVKTVNYLGIIAYLIQTIKELDDKITVIQK